MFQPRPSRSPRRYPLLPSMSAADRRPVTTMSTRQAIQVLLPMLLLSASQLPAADLLVTTTDDNLSGPACSLRAALLASDRDSPVGGCPAGDPGLDRVTVPAGFYALLPEGPGDEPGETGDLDVAGPVEIVGAGPESTTVQPAGSATDRILEVLEGGVVTLADLSVRDGRAERGGGLLVGRGGALTLRGCRVIANEATSGGGLFLDRASATLEGCEVAENRASAGGGIYGLRGTLTVSESLLEQNEAVAMDPLSGATGSSGGGGAIAMLGGSTQVETTEIVGNRADDTRWGGGGLLVVGGDLTVSRSTLAGNTATDAMDDGSAAHPDHDESGGGAISAWDSTVRLENTTLSENGADDTRLGGGGLLSIHSDVAVAHSTFWGNSADGAPAIGDTLAGGSLSTPTKNAEEGRAVVVGASILAGGSPAECMVGANGPPDGGIVANLIDDGSCGALAGSNGPVTGFDTQLADHGGPTRAHRLLAGSNAVDAGGAGCVGAGGGALLMGQRGVVRPQDGFCDLGAVERLSTVNLAVSGLQAAALPEPGGAVEVELTFDNPGPLPVTAGLQVGGAVTGLGTCGPSVVVVADDFVLCSIEVTVAGQAGPLGVTIPIPTSSPDASGTEMLEVDLELADVLPAVDLRAFVKPGFLEAPGGEARLHVSVSNPGVAESVSVVGLEDETGPLGGDCQSIGSLAPGQTATCEVTVHYDGVAGSRPTRTLTVTVADDEGSSASDVVSVGPQIVSVGSIIFNDCFESGDLSAWSASTP